MSTFRLPATVVRCSVLLLMAAAALSCGPVTSPVCGNGHIDPGEACDGHDVGPETCGTMGFNPGTLGCAPNCHDFDRSTCGAPASCGNGTVQSPEFCDGTNLAGATCQSLGFGPGTLRCAANCGAFDTSQCGPPPTCGNGLIDPPMELCDGAALANKSCADFGRGDGTLRCAANCLSFDLSGCGVPPGCVPQCNGRQCGVDPVCGQPCGTCGDPMTRCDTTVGVCQKFCDLAPLASDTTLPFDLKTAVVSGQVTLNGAQLPNNTGTGPRGSLLFRRADSGSTVRVNLPATGAGTWQTTLFVGTYEVTFDGQYNSTPVLPAQTVSLGTLNLLAAATQSYDLKTVTVGGAVTLNGVQMPNNSGTGPRGSLLFARADTGSSIRVNLPATGAASYQTTLFAGAYAVTFDGQYNSTPVLPAQTTSLGTVTFTGAATQNYDLATAAVSGAVTLNGVQMPNNTGTGARGSLLFRRADTGSTLRVNLPATGAASYQTTLFTGAYAVTFDGQYNSTPVLPALTTNVGTFTLSGASTQNYNLATVAVSGAVTLNGAVMPNNTGTGPRGSLLFRRADSGSTLRVNLPATGAASYQATVFAGSYGVTFDGQYNSTPVLPTQTMSLGRLDLNQAVTQNFDLPTVAVTGAVTLNGAQMPNNTGTGPRGSLLFLRADTGSTLRVNLPATGVASYQTKVFSGTYAVTFDGQYNSSPVLPTETIALKTLGLTAASTQNFDLATVNVSGTVTLNGVQVPNNTGTGPRGSLLFQRTDTGSTLRVNLPATGVASYQAKLFAGPNSVRFDGQYNSTPVLPAEVLTLERGCPAVDASCTATTADATGQWMFDFSSWSYNLMNVSLTQSGSTLGGTFDFVGLDQGTVSGTAANGGTLHFTAHGASYSTVVDGSLMGGCLMTGSATVDNGQSSDFVARRLQ